MKKIYLEDSDYPECLKDIKNPPKELYCEGNIRLLGKPSITVIGSRNMSEYGRKMAKNITKDLVLGGICIVSGMAVGIDAVAHETCVENGGKTIAVLGSGLNQVFPAENRGLFKKIINNGGCVISEYPPETIAKKRFFPERNRIVSGLSLGTIVVEATYRSGTSITAKFALEQGKKLFCVPNSVGNKNSAGILNLLKSGASLITTGKDVLYDLGFIDKNDSLEEIEEKQRVQKLEILESEELESLDEDAKKLYFYIKDNKIANLEMASSQLKMSIQKINMYLTILELKGLVVSKSGGCFEIKY